MIIRPILILLFLLPFTTFAQKDKSNALNQVTKDELNMRVYESDSLAHAVVLYEHANIYLDEKNNYNFRTDYYYRIKLFNKGAFKEANIKIPLYKKEKIQDIKAVTYNLKNGSISKSFLKKEDIFTTQEDEYWRETKFTLPNLKEGSVIEYVYSVISPYSQLDDWSFQSDIPKVKSEYDAAIVGNYKYNLRLIGNKELEKKEFSSKKNCVSIPGLESGGCNIYSFGMDNIPAFKEEDYMLSKKNYQSRLILDLLSYTDVHGGVKEYTKTWKDADRTLKQLFLDNQTTKSSFFRKNLPEDILSLENELEKAKQVYKYIQSKLFWNEKYWTRGKLKIKNTFEEGTGSVDAINLILYNSLKAAGIESYIVASSTRNNGLPTKLYPITKDFNYILIKVVIEDKTYFLDATDKKLAFGQIPFKCINGDGRVLDFKNGSYWEPINTDINSIVSIRTTLDFDEDSNLVGTMQITKSGYEALSERKLLGGKTEDESLDYFESKHPNILAETMEVKNKDNLEEPLIENLDILIETGSASDILRINPFVYRKITTNPFKLKERKYEIDYGYPRTFLSAIKLNVPDTYEIVDLPKSKAFTLSNGGGNFMINISENNNVIIIYTRMYILKKTYSSEEYAYLKEFYNQIIKAQQLNLKFKKLNN